MIGIHRLLFTRLVFFDLYFHCSTVVMGLPAISVNFEEEYCLAEVLRVVD